MLKREGRPGYTITKEKPLQVLLVVTENNWKHKEPRMCKWEKVGSEQERERERNGRGRCIPTSSASANCLHWRKNPLTYVFQHEPQHYHSINTSIWDCSLQSLSSISEHRLPSDFYHTNYANNYFLHKRRWVSVCVMIVWLWLTVCRHIDESRLLRQQQDDWQHSQRSPLPLRPHFSPPTGWLQPSHRYWLRCTPLI